MSVWYQFDVTVLSPNNSSYRFSHGEKNGSGFDEMISKYKNDILVIDMTVECTSGSSWLQKIDKTSGKEQTILLDSFNGSFSDETEYEFNAALAQEYKELFPDHKYYDWKLFINTYDKANTIFSNIEKYEQITSILSQDVDIDFDNQILDTDYD